MGQKSYARLPRQSNGADNPYLIMSDQPAAQSMARQKARCLIFNGYVWRWQASQAPQAPPPPQHQPHKPPPAPIVCTLLPLYSPLLSPPLVTIHNDYFAHRARGLPFQIIPSKLEVAPPLSKMSHRFLDSTNKLKSRSTCVQCTDKLQTDNLIIENCKAN